MTLVVLLLVYLYSQLGVWSSSFAMVRSAYVLLLLANILKFG